MLVLLNWALDPKTLVSILVMWIEDFGWCRVLMFNTYMELSPWLCMILAIKFLIEHSIFFISILIWVLNNGGESMVNGIWWFNKIIFEILHFHIIFHDPMLGVSIYFYQGGETTLSIWKNLYCLHGYALPLWWRPCKMGRKMNWKPKW